ncbi:MAG: GHKL domain-containing protein, partial [Clostridia bacterium]|nr:GHKL domain-containing protein [Clostridia bacterium]
EMPEAERSIGLSVKSINDFVAIHVYNGYGGDIKFENGLPITRKQSKAYHGFGLKSVKHTVEKYDGVLRVSADDGIFNVKILFPLAV